MKVVKWMILLGVLGFAYQTWSEHKHSRLVALEGDRSPSGFVHTAMPAEARPGRVLILAPMNCPSAAAQRADALAEELDRMGIPAMRANQFSVDVTNPTDEERAGLERMNLVLSGEIPAVFINGMGKANPTAEEVAAEYERTN